MNGRLLAVSDLHGCVDHFIALLRQIKLTKADRLVLLGDYVDRGPKSKQLVQLLINLQRQFPRTIMLKGNHEDMFLNYLAGKDKDLFMYNGGTATLDSYQADEYGVAEVSMEHIEFLENLPLSYETDDFFFCHAGVFPDEPLSNQIESDLLWIRDDFLWDDTDHGKIVVHGHTPTIEPDVRTNRIGIDTGGVFGDSFTAADLTDPKDIKFITIKGYIRPRANYGW